MYKILKKMVWPFFLLFVDEYTYFDGKKNPNKFKFAWYTLKFKLAAKGIFLSANEKKLAALKDKHKGHRCFIIGNGPSLNKLDLTLLRNEYTFGVNAIYLNYEKMKFAPTYYVVEDYLVAEDRNEEISAYDKPEIKFWGTYLDYALKSDQRTIKLNVCLKYLEPFVPFFSKNILRIVGVGGSVTFICLQLAYYMGFDEVYMIGFDHNYTIPKHADLRQTTTITSQADDVNHFSKDYFGKGYRWHDPRVDNMEKGFTEARRNFEQSGRKIYNATLGGHLEVFERVDYEKLF
jgi:hypothetical protein